MRQPEIGIKIAEERKKKGLTQEELAHQCQLNVRSIQRLEAGEVEPRLSTLALLSTVLEYEFHLDNGNPTNFWLLFMHLSSMVPLVVIPLIIWVLYKDEDRRIEEHGVDVLNFQLSMMIYLFAATFSIFFVIGILILPLMGIFIFFISIINTIKVAMGENYKYPFTINFISKKGNSKL